MEMEERTLQTTTVPTQAPVYLQATGLFLLRYGLAAMMLLFGLQKWTKAEAEGIQPWVSHSPLMSWLYLVTSVQGASIAIGVVELAIAVMIISRRWLPGIAAIGSAMAIVMFLITLSFLITTPNIAPGSQGFLMKDIFLLGVAIWSTGESLTELVPRVPG
jgi:reactive chlorine resistance protein C